MAIMTLTCERFTQTVITENAADAVKQLVVSFLVAALCFVVINWSLLQILIVAFPELLLVNIAVNIAMGSWTGMRTMEYLRFGDIIRHSQAQA
jgi:ABC-type multidrug transport system fused ATPase/permease subunit